jgi:hypothetical protein
MRLMVSRRPQSRAPVWLTTITLDSARAISKFDNQGRKDVPLPFDGTPVNFQFDSAMSTLPVTEGPIGPAQLPDTARRAFTKALAPVFLLPLPRGAASAGTTWTADQPVPLSDLMPTGVPGAVSGPRVLTAHVNAKLDSLVSRGTDTLAYVSYSGTFEPVQSSYRDSTGVTSITVAGAIAASQIWSTAWSGWVSGGLRARAEIKLHNESADAVISADITARMQVRP